MDSKDYLQVLEAMHEIPFGVGKGLLVDFLIGNEKNESIKRNRLDRLKGFGSLAYTEDELEALVDKLAYNSMIKYSALGSNRFIKVLELTKKGLSELENPTLTKHEFETEKTVITALDKIIFNEFKDFLNELNDEQKKAVVSPKQHIICLAGAGTGKTTVLAKRIMFLCMFRSIDQKRMLAITFTRKARQEMINRIPGMNNIETFNSFCEKMLLKYNDLAYKKRTRMLSFSDRNKLFVEALEKIGTTMKNAIDEYFNKNELADKTNDELAIALLNDCFLVREFIKAKRIKPEKKGIILDAAIEIDKMMEEKGLRDYPDQLSDTINLFKNHPELIPEFEHILVDEYQDINSSQTELIELLRPKNLFCVGDPRQSIYGWRGSELKHLSEFPEKYPEAETIILTKNYRSTKHITKLANETIKPMGLPDLENTRDGEKETRLLGFETEDAEIEFISQMLEKASQSTFILARTNKQITALSSILKLKGINHVTRTDMNSIAQESLLTLATIHAIKGMEADTVFVMGCNSINFPCKGTEHPIIEAIANYDREEEERRLFYVAISRAKNRLYLTYHGKSITPYINSDMVEILNPKQTQQKTGSGKTLQLLKEWRQETSSLTNTPAYMILHDSTLIEIAQKMPEDEKELSGIKGMGPIKVLKYGKDILGILGR